MPRKPNTTAENYDKALPKRLRLLLEQSGVKQADVGAAIGKTRQSVSCYADGSTAPDWQTIVKLANFFDVSTDWLLGVSDVRSRDSDIINACKVTGLTEDAVKTLAKFCATEYGPFQSFTYMLENEGFFIEIFSSLDGAATSSTTDTVLEIDGEPIYPAGVKGGVASGFYLFLANQNFLGLCENFVDDYRAEHRPPMEED